MKKNILISIFLFSFLALGIFYGHKQKISKNVGLRLGGKLEYVSLENLGVGDYRITEEKIRSKETGIVSIISAGEKIRRVTQKQISVNTEQLIKSVIKTFPVLNSPEDASESFYLTRENQTIKLTFNVRRLVDQLINNADNSSQQDIDIEIIPNDEEILEKLPEVYLNPEEVQGKTLVIRSVGDDIQKQEWKIPLGEENWLLTDTRGTSINRDKLVNYLQKNIVTSVERPVQNAIIKGFSNENKAVRADVEGIVQDGIRIPVEKNIEIINNAISSGNFNVNLELERETGRVINETNIDLGNMNLIGAGRSNFVGSPEGRAFNIRKGLGEKMNNIIVPPGATFSFNSFLGGLKSSDGWKMALGIFGGGTVKPTLGGGLCQVSTTVYRAVLAAGLPILQRRSHSLYVKYYKEYGEGLDATVYVGGQDLVFTNNTPSYIFMQAYGDDDDGYVNIFGTSDGRSVSLDGPYHFNNIPPEKSYKPKKNEIVWFRLIKWPDGGQTFENIVSRYKVVPHPAQ